MKPLTKPLCASLNKKGTPTANTDLQMMYKNHL